MSPFFFYLPCCDFCKHFIKCEVTFVVRVATCEVTNFIRVVTCGMTFAIIDTSEVTFVSSVALDRWARAASALRLSSSGVPVGVEGSGSRLRGNGV